jgi:uncharacterized membrane protein YhaH (DUF805 family)
MWLAVQKFVSAIFNGVPSDELGKYTTQITGVIGIYICFIAIFLTGLYVRRLHNRPPTNRDRENAMLPVTYATLLALSGTAIYIVYFLINNG